MALPELPLLRIDTDWGLTFTFGYRFNPRLELQIAFDWSEVEYRTNVVNGDLPNISVYIDGSMDVITPRVNGVFNFSDGPIS